MDDTVLGISPKLEEEAIKFVNQITGQPINEISSLMADTVKYWRFKNQLKILQKAKKDLESARLNPKQVPMKFLVPFLEGCSLEDEGSMQDRWCALLSNAINPQNENIILPSYIEILKQLSPREAKMLDVIFDTYGNDEFSIDELFFYENIIDNCKIQDDDNYIKNKYRHFNKIKELELNNKEIRIYIDNFIRLGLLKYNITENLYETLSSERKELRYISDRNHNNPYVYDKLSEMDGNEVQFTPMGIDFIEVCRTK